MMQQDDSDDDGVHDPDESDMDSDDSETDACLCCGKQIYEDSEWCPHCGKYLSEEDGPFHAAPWIIAGTVVALLVVVTWILLG